MGSRDTGEGRSPDADCEREPSQEHIRAKESENLARGNEVAGAVFGTVIQAGAIHGDVHIEKPHASPSRETPGSVKAAAVPAQLRAGPTYFASRTDELTVLERLLQDADPDTPMLITVSGTGGVGKTSLCLRWLHQIRDRYPDGQLYADLGGFASTDPTPTGDVLERFLRALGMAAEAVPTAEDEQAAAFRTLAAGRRLILMLDNAATAAQVRPLLPGAGPSVVVVTSRLRLTGLALDGAHFIDLSPLDEDGGLVLLRRMLGSERICAEVQAARSLVALCARLPLAICASAARLAARPRLSIAQVVQDLTDEARRLAVLGKHADVSVQATFDVSYAALSTEAARAYRLLAMHPGSEFDVGAAAAITETDDYKAGELLDCLFDASLIEERPPDRYGFHDLLRLHARGKAYELEPEHERRAALDRLARWYLWMAVCADRTVIRGRWHLGNYYNTDDGIPAPFDSSSSALDWLERELPTLAVLVDVLHRDGFPELSWQVCEAMWSLFIYRKHYRYWLRTHRSGLSAARACHNPLAEARMLEGLAMAHLNLQDFEAAAACCAEALKLERANDHPDGEATSLEYLGVVELGRERPERAVELFRRAQDIHRRIGGTRGVALMNRRIGEALRNAGDYSAAITHLGHARRYFADNSDAYNLARTLTGLGQVYLLSGRPTEADRVLEEALQTSAEIGARLQEANIHIELAQSAAATGNQAVEQRHLRRAHAIYVALDAPQAEDVEGRLTQLPE
jgi:tetratricopeptide (TPR) repeat protein